MLLSSVRLSVRWFVFFQLTNYLCSIVGLECFNMIYLGLFIFVEKYFSVIKFFYLPRKLENKKSILNSKIIMTTISNDRRLVFTSSSSMCSKLLLKHLASDAYSTTTRSNYRNSSSSSCVILGCIDSDDTTTNTTCFQIFKVIIIKKTT